MRIAHLRWWLVVGVCAAAIAWLLSVALTSNIQYFRTASEAVADKTQDGDHTFRLAGAVVPGTVHAVTGGVDFDVTDGKATVLVHHQGDPPELFKPGAPVVVEGHWQHTWFASDRILIKHGAQYAPPKVNTKAKTTVTKVAQTTGGTG
jgi:cytochrome c-type biogenesis protein CcmE